MSGKHTDHPLCLGPYLSAICHIETVLYSINVSVKGHFRLEITIKCIEGAHTMYEFRLH